MKTITHEAHTADICLKIEADSIPELFEAALEGMNEILYPDFCKAFKGGEKSLDININASDKTNLLIDFLSEILTATVTENTMYCQLEIDELSETHIKAVLSGVDVVEFHEDIKAVTYHDADVRMKENGKWSTFIIFDI